jgi:hypothetical protein
MVRVVAHHAVDDVRVGPDQDAESALTSSRMIFAASAALVGASVTNRRARSTCMRSMSASEYFDASRPIEVSRVRICAICAAFSPSASVWVCTLSELSRMPVPICPGMTTDTLMCGAFIRKSAISASVKPFTANFAAE